MKSKRSALKDIGAYLWDLVTFSNVVASAVVMLAVPFMYWAIVDRQPVATSVSEVLDQQVLQGGFLEIQYDVVWRSDCEIVAFRYIIDEMRIEWPIAAQQRIVDAGPQQFTIRVPVPAGASPGMATYRGTLRYECNPWQRFFPLEQDLRPRFFEIIRNPDLIGEEEERTRGPASRRFAGIYG